MGGGIEVFGLGDPVLSLSASLGTNLNISNYKGISVDFTFGSGVRLMGCFSAGINMGIGSQTGAGIDYNAGINFKSSQIISSDVGAGVGVSVGSGYSSRSGLKNIGVSFSGGLSTKVASLGASNSASIPIGTQNYVPVITNSSTMHSIEGRIKLGGEVLWCSLYGDINAMRSKLVFNAEASRKSYGYLFSEEATDSDIHDFTRDKDGSFNKSMSNLPPGNMTYDIYSVNGQGTGGMFRPFRNDFGWVFDPVTKSESSSESYELEGSLGWLFGFGGDVTASLSNSYSGPWGKYKRAYAKQQKESLFEKTYFKQGGELTSVDPLYFDAIHKKELLHASDVAGLPVRKPGARDPRANYIYAFDAKEASIPGVASHQRLYSYTSTNGFAAGPAAPKDSFARAENTPYKRKDYHLSEITQVQTDGRRYVYGIAAMNNIQKDATFSVDPPNNSDMGAGLVAFHGGVEDSKNNSRGIDHYYSATITPAFTHSYLLTSVLSTDYRDVTGDGPSDDDLGSYTKMNYTLKDKDYRWRAPFYSDKAQYNPGFWSDKRDDKGSYVMGSREQWILHSIETKNYIAEFYTSKRIDGKGSNNQISYSSSDAPYNSPLTDEACGSSYKLDSIKLYNKHDRFLNQEQAVPIKTVYFSYDYSLCKNIPNAWPSDTAVGKLTLRKIYTKWGSSERSMVSPYQFEYSSFNPDYDQARKDRWGSYKPNNTSFTNYEFPFVNQVDPDNDLYASAWSLTKVHLPSGGQIEVNYEADDYAYVQNKEAAEMFLIQGVGNSKNYYPGNSQLSYNESSPNLYAYFKRRPASELPGLSFKENYLKDLSCVYYNFNVNLVDGKYECIKGYAEVQDIGVCNDTIGYIKFKGVIPKGDNALVHPVAYTAVNLGRYSLPHIIYPGADPESSDIVNILAGLGGAFGELVGIGENPVTSMIKSGKAKYADLAKSYIRLNTPGLRKKGGGHRVKSLLFYDSWQAMAGGNSQNATYGKVYDYTIAQGGGAISSGVASYEPMIGGDENPFRIPHKYEAQIGGDFPPHDAVSLYQETPFGESLFPAPSVGYSSIMVKSIHEEIGRSAQAFDIHRFYTAKDYPFRVEYTGLEDKEDNYDFKLMKQVNTFEATQGYTIILNDMHGKPKSMHRYVNKPKGGEPELISYKIFEYYTRNGLLDNTVPVARYSTDGKIHKVEAQLGVEADVTIDTREKTERSENSTFNMNINVVNILLLPIVVPLGYPWNTSHINEFRSAVVTKVIQQYGIIKNVKEYNEGALTTVSNEVFDPLTGQAVVTSVNNEFKDKIYNTTYPAYWGYRGMGPSYANTAFEGFIDTVKTENFEGVINTPPESLQGLRVGDELLMTFRDSIGVQHTAITWVQDFKYQKISDLPNIIHCCRLTMMPRYPNNTAGWPKDGYISQINYKVIRSGCKNMLNENIEQYSGFANPFDNSNVLKSVLDSLINISAKTFSADNPTLEAYLPDDDNVSLNRFLNGSQGIYRLSGEYAYMTPRNYPGPARSSGLFSAKSLWLNFIGTEPCMLNDVKPVCSTAYLSISAPYLALSLFDANWHLARKVTKWSPFGFEVENQDALKNYTTAVYGYNQQLPVAVAQNANYGEVLTEGFEDFNLLRIVASWMTFNYSPFGQLFPVTGIAGSPYGVLGTSGTGSIQLVRNVAHSGYYALKTPVTGSAGFASSTAITLPVSGSEVFLSDIKNYRKFTLQEGKKYLLSYWIKTTGTTTPNSYVADGAGIFDGTSIIPAVAKSNLIDGWQQLTCSFTAGSNTKLLLPVNYYIDDIRLFPVSANMKSFVYHPYSQKLVATLDENNFATFYEYDQEGNLVRTKKETERGILTVSESRSVHPNTNQ